MHVDAPHRYVTEEQKRELAFSTINAFKATGRKFQPAAVRHAFSQLHELDPKSYVFFESAPPRSDQCHDEKHHAPTRTGLVGFGTTAGGELVPIQQPFTPEEIDERNGWHEPDDGIVSERDEQFAFVAEYLGEIVRYLAKEPTLPTIGLKAAALCLMLQPAAMGGDGTQSDLARKLGLTRAAVQKHCRAFREMANGIYTARCQLSPEGSEACRERATRQHRERKG